MTSWIITSVLGLILLGSAWRCYRLGLAVTLVNFGGFLLATGAASAFYLGLASLFYRLIGTPHGLINLAAFIIIWLVVELLYRLGLSYIRLRKLYLPESASSLPSKIGGAVMGLAQALLVTTLGLVTLLALPFPTGFKNELSQARLAKPLVAAG